MEKNCGLVIPAYQPNIEQLSSYIGELTGELTDSEIRVEIDDPTEREISELSALPVSVGFSSTRRGKGAAIMSGFDALDADIYAFVDADGSTLSKSVPTVIEAVRSGNADLAVGSRRHPDAMVLDPQPRVRRFLGEGYAWLTQRLLSLTLYDYQCGAKALSSEAWQRIRSYIREPGFGWDIELLEFAAKSDFRIAEVPILWDDSGESTVSLLWTPLQMGYALFRVWLRTVGSDFERPASTEDESEDRTSSILRKEI